MGIFKKSGEDKHDSYGVPDWQDLLSAKKEAESKGNKFEVDSPHPGSGQPFPHGHEFDGPNRGTSTTDKVINIDPSLKDPMDYDD